MLAKLWWKGSPSALLARTQTGAATVESSIEFPGKIKNETALWPSDSASENRSEENQNTDLKEYMNLYAYCSFIYNSQDLKAV